MGDGRPEHARRGVEDFGDPSRAAVARHAGDDQVVGALAHGETWLPSPIKHRLSAVLQTAATTGARGSC